MLRLLRWFIWGDGHLHHWKIIRQGPRTLSDRNGRVFPNGHYYDLQCENCGDVKSKNS